MSSRRQRSIGSLGVHRGVDRSGVQPRCAQVPLRRAVPMLARRRLLAACGGDDEARRIVENVIDGTYVDDGDPWAYDGVYCTLAALRALLLPHDPVDSGRCAACQQQWPCWSWRETFAWIVLYDPVHGHRVYDWCHHTVGDTISIGLMPSQTGDSPEPQG